MLRNVNIVDPCKEAEDPNGTPANASNLHRFSNGNLVFAVRFLQNHFHCGILH